MQLFNTNIQLTGSSNFPLPKAYTGPQTRSRAKELTGIQKDVGVALSYFKKVAGLESSPQLITQSRSSVKVDHSALEVWIGRAAAVITIAGYILNSTRL